MKKKKIIIVILAIILLIGYFSSSLYKNYKLQHNIEYNYNKYLWLFKDSLKVDTLFFSGNVREKDFYYHYIYNNNNKNQIEINPVDTLYYVTIWEFKDLGKINLKEIKINNVNLDNIQFKSGEIFNETDSIPLITAKLGLEFKTPFININIDEKAVIENNYDHICYKGFFGKLGKLSINNNKDEPQILMETKKGEKALFLMYKVRQSFFIIYILSNKDSDESIINILNMS